MRRGDRPLSAIARVGLVLVTVVAFVVPVAGLADSPEEPTAPELVLLGGDEVVPDPGDLGALGLQSADPLGLVPAVDVVRAHSLGTDVIDVWTCGIPPSPSEVVAVLNEQVRPYFSFHSGGRLDVQFVPRGSGPADPQACLDAAAADASPDANGAMIVDGFGGGLAGPGSGQSWPGNARFARVGWDDYFVTVATHEYGHMHAWPHSFTGTVPRSQNGEYDNAVDVMSGNFGLTQLGGGGYRYGTNPEPYETAVINRYAAGWIDPDQVTFLQSSESTVTLAPSGGGTQMAVIPAGARYFTLGARTSSTYDPIPDQWQGVEVYEVTPCPFQDLFECLGDPRFDMGFREIVPLGRVSFDFSDVGAYERPLPHVIQPGSSKTVGGRTVTVEAAPDGAYEVTIGEGAAPIFTDTAGSVFEADIAWMAAAGITKGCDPPVNSRFCPDDPVTRAQMAAFLHRALPDLETTGAGVDFVDDEGSVFEADIGWLSASGVTKGCDPPVNSRFCPDDPVTRAQMAAFLHRALPDLETAGAGVDFVDDEGSVFEADIEWLSATGVTRGCNPPANDRFCPNDPVTRGAMAAFLNRALGG